VYGAVPPPPIADAVPLHAPKQETLLKEVTTFKAVGLIIFTAVDVRVHPLESVTVNEYVPAHLFETEGVVSPPGDHKNVYPGVPPEMLEVIVTSQAPLQETFKALGVMVTLSAVGAIKFMTWLFVQPFASLTFTV